MGKKCILLYLFCNISHTHKIKLAKGHIGRNSVPFNLPFTVCKTIHSDFLCSVVLFLVCFNINFLVNSYYYLLYPLSIYDLQVYV